MKRFMLLLLLMGSLLWAEGYNQCEVGLFFGNGMRNTKADAVKSRKGLETRISQYDQQLYKRLQFDLAYNHKELFSLEVFEVMKQWLAQHDLMATVEREGYNFYQIMAHLEESMPPQVWRGDTQDWSEFRQTVLDTIARISREQLYADSDLQEHVTLYKSRIAQSGGAVLVGHSQGNFYGNLAYGALEASERSRFKMNSVATPASYVSGGGPWVTLTTDAIRFVPGSLSANYTNTNISLDPQTQQTVGEGHGFVPAYLMGDRSRPAILSHIADAVAALDNAPSPWQVTEETEPGTCEHRVTLQNTQSGEVVGGVYPFDKTNGKLYQLSSGEWVLAACGGENLLDSWEGQGEDGCFKLEETGEVIREKPQNFVCGSYSQPYDARADGFSVVQTGCNGSIASGSPSSIWDPWQGFFQIAGGGPSYAYFSSMAQKYNVCLYSSNAIRSIGADCGCFECWLYWGR